MGIAYATREDVKAALDIAETARNNKSIDSAIESGSRAVEGLLHRKFYPVLATRYKDWPNQQGNSYRVWLDDDEVAELTSLVSGGVTIATADYNLEPINSGPPYDRIEINTGTTGSFSAGSTFQRAIAMSGTFCGGPLEWLDVADLSANVASTSVTTASVTDASQIGTGSLLKIDSEWLRVTARTWTDTTKTLSADVAAVQSTRTVTPSGGTFYAGEVLMIDSEKMLITDVVGANLMVLRAYDGSVLAAHVSTTAIYVLGRNVTVQRAVLGTTAATHTAPANVYAFNYPGLVHELCIAESLNTLLNKQSGYARAVGSGDNVNEYMGRAIKDIRAEAYAAHGRKARIRSV